MALAALLGPGCASSDVSGDAAVMSGVAECLPPAAPVPSMVVRAVWFPNASSFGSAGTMGIGHVTGVLALAGDSLWFMGWNGPEHHYDMVRAVALLTAADVSVARLGPSAMLVVQSRNLSHDGFELMGAGGLGSDPKATQELYDRIQALRARNPPEDP